MCSESSAIAAKQRSGRNVTHSRRGCLTCKRRKLRCPENRPICARCWNDNRVCHYGIQLQWEDESRSRGVKHGRSTRAAKHPGWESWVQVPVRRRVEHFINTTVSDLEDEISIPSSGEWSPLLRRGSPTPSLLSWPRAIPTLQPGQDGLLFDYYLQRVCQNMTLVDDSSNAFRHIILPISLSSESVMQMVLALGALTLTAAGQHDLYPVALRHKHRTIQLLRHDIGQPETAVSDYNLIAILMLCVFEISDSCQASWSTHLCAAVDMLRLRMDAHDASVITPAVSTFVSKFFLVKDALGRSACGKRAKVKELPPVHSDEIDPSVGCSYELIGIISSITDLSREMATGGFVTSVSWSDKAALVDHQLESLTQRLPPCVSSHTSMDSPNLEVQAGLSPSDILLCTSSLMHTAAKLYFIATLRSADPYAPRTQELVSDAIQWIKPLSPMYLRSAHLWPLFVTAVYVTEDEDRLFLLDQFSVLERQDISIVAAGSVGRAREIVETVWKRRDLELRSSVSANEKNIWARYVQPMSDELSLG
ncbi:hypothetical protein VTN00DRAFT_9668 [Thermoascus crustaceus]|uniref:uncharacterized protein n=1 Tax=Thermoascus crustaceus TaxID=5088 RepID=UPI00374283EE